MFGEGEGVAHVPAVGDNVGAIDLHAGTEDPFRGLGITTGEKIGQGEEAEGRAETYDVATKCSARLSGCLVHV